MLSVNLPINTNFFNNNSIKKFTKACNKAAETVKTNLVSKYENLRALNLTKSKANNSSTNTPNDNSSTSVITPSPSFISKFLSSDKKEMVQEMVENINHNLKKTKELVEQKINIMLDSLERPQESVFDKSTAQIIDEFYDESSIEDFWYESDDESIFESHTTTPIQDCTTSLSICSTKLDFDFDFQLNEKIVFVMVGLPAAGKSTISKQLSELFNQYSLLKSRIYNAGNVRRDCQEENDANFFDPNDERAKMLRESYVNITIGNLISDLNQGIRNIGFLDATNSTVERRKRMIAKIKDEVTNPTIILMDVSCSNSEQSNFNIACKSKNADYSMKNYHDSIRDFQVRIDNYLKAYQPITVEELITYPIHLYINFADGGETFDIVSYNTVNANFAKLLDQFVGEYAENFGNEYLKRVEEWMVFIKGLDSKDSDAIKQNLKAELQY